MNYVNFFRNYVNKHSALFRFHRALELCKAHSVRSHSYIFGRLGPRPRAAAFFHQSAGVAIRPFHEILQT